MKQARKALGRFLASLLSGVSAGDPFTFAMAVAFLGLLAFLANLLSGASRTKVDPTVALR